MKIFGSIQELVELVYRIGSNTVTLKPNSSQATSITLSLPVLTGNDTVVTNSSTASFSNKTINLAVGGNTISQMTIGSFGQSLGDADKVLLRDVNGTVQHAKIADINVDAAAAIALTKLATVTASRALQSDGSGNISASSITSTELGHLSGVTSNIQTQLNSKEGTITVLPISKGGTNSSTSLNNNRVMVSSGSAIVEAAAITANRALASSASGIPVASSVTDTELGRLSGITSSAVGVSDSQTLLNKQISSTAAITGALTLPAGTEAERPTPVEGMVRLNTDTDSFEGYANGVWSGIGGGGTTDRVTQASAGFVVGDLLYVIGANTYAKAIASAANTAEVVGMVSRIIDSTPATFTFEITLSGEVSGLGSPTPLVPGEVYFLDPTTAGGFTTTEPSTIGQVSVPVGVASSTTTMYVAPKRGVVVGGVNARTEVALTSGATTNVQNVAGMSAGELSGWVFISSAAPKRFYISAKFSLSGAGGDYNLSYQTSGDAPPTGFLVDITTTGIIRVTLPASSGSTSAINYALNAPAIGASFPLTVNANTILSGTLGAARLPAPSAYSDAEATRMGLKTYVGGTNVTVSSTTSATSSSYKFIPYQMQDGSWRLKFNFSVTLSANITLNTFTVTGVVFKNISGTAYQGICAVNSAVPAGVSGLCDNNTNTIRVFATAAANQWGVSGDVELESKPSWAS